MKNTPDGIIGRLDTTVEQISEFEDNTIQTYRNKVWKEKTT